MATKAGRLVINLSAGTAQYIVDMESATKTNKRFEQGVDQVKKKLNDLHEVSGVQATSAALRVLEGGITNNLRAGERFLAQTLGLGEALKTAFPVFGAVALGGVVVELAEHINKVRQEMQRLQDLPSKIAEGFQGINAPLQLVNDELAVSNERLAMDIAKITGRPTNGLALALAEAKVAADKLAESLDKDLSAMQKVLQENKVGWFGQLLGKADTSDIATKLAEYQQQINKITQEGREKLNTTPDSSKSSVELQTNLKLYEELGQAIAYFNSELKKSQDIENQKYYTIDQKGNRQYTSSLGAGGGFSNPEYREQSARLAALRPIIQSLREEWDHLSESERNADLSGQKAFLEAVPKQRIAPTDEVAQKLSELKAKLAEVRAEATAGGSGNLFTDAIAKAAGESAKAVEDLQRRLAEQQKAWDQKTPQQKASEQKPQTTLTIGNVADITALQTDIALTQMQTRASDQQKQKMEELQAAHVKLWEDLDRENAKIQQNIALIREHTAELQAQSKAVFSGGISGERQAKLDDFDNQAAAGKMSPEEAAAKKAELQATYDLQDIQAAFNRTHDQTLEKLQSELAALQKQAQASGETADIAAAILSTQKEIAKIQDQQILATGDLKDGWDVFWRELQENTRSAAQDMRDVLGGAVTSLNDDLAKVITGQKVNWSKFFFGLADQIAKLGLQAGEVDIAKMLGLGSPSSGGVLGTGVGARAGGSGGGSQQGGGILGGIFGQLFKGTSPNVPNVLPGGFTAQDNANLTGFDPGELSQLANGSGGSSPDGSELNPLYVTVPGAGSLASSGVSSIFGDLAKSSGSLIGSLLHLLPGFAAGGDQDGPAIVGENGPEISIPRGPRTIIPNGQFGAGGQTVTNIIDARGSTNSAETEMRVRRATREAHQQGAADGAKISRESRARVPRSKAFST